MAIVNVPFERPTDRHEGEQASGMAWLPRLVGADFTRFSAGEVSIAVEAHTYTGPSSWGDGASEPVGRGGHVFDGPEARDMIRAAYPHVEAIVAILEAGVARRIGGSVVPNPRPGWVDEPMETTGLDPEGPDDPDGPLGDEEG